MDENGPAKGGLWVIAGAIALPVLIIGLVLAIALGGANTAAACGPAARVDPDNLAVDSVDGYDAEQLRIAALVMNAAAERNLGRDGQIVGVMAAIGESSLRNLDYGDDLGGVTNPDGSPTCSLGIMQQQWCLGWGTREQVLDPAYAAGAFFERLAAVDGWAELDRTLAINRVQGNADPYHYQRFENSAAAIVDALAPGAAGVGCSTSGWASPVDLNDPNMMLTSWFGMRSADLFGYAYFHSGVDFSAPVGTPVYAAAGGTVVTAITNQGTATTGYGNVVLIDHGGGVQTRYQHMPPGGVQVEVGQTVQAGEQIGLIGDSGASSGSHLHFSLLTGGKTTTDYAIDPIPFFLEHGVDFCSLPQAAQSSTVNTCR